MLQGQSVGILEGSIMAALLWEARGLLWLQATWEKQTRRVDDDTVVYVGSPLPGGPKPFNSLIGLFVFILQERRLCM